MFLWGKKSRIVITCAKGVSPFLKQEILSVGFPALSAGMAEVETEGTMEDTQRLNLLIRTGQRVLYLLESFSARTPEDLYKRVSRISWEDYIPEDSYFSVTSSVHNPTIKDSRFANVKCKDAIVDRIKEKRGRRPDTGPERDKIVVHLYWKGNICQVFLDTSGEPLSRRGYRMIPLKAPMQETLGAAVVLATGWTGDGNLINPMCGSGTLAIEAALIALERAPGLLRSNYGFMHLRGFDEPSWKILRRKIRAEAKDRLSGRIIATDISQQAVEAAKKNAMTAGVERFIEFGICNFSETPVPSGGGAVVLNPEYGERLGETEKLKETYKNIGDFFKKKCQGYRGYLFTGNLDLAKKVGLRTNRRITFFNGPIECRLLEYDLYEGSKKSKD
ncbi:MAG: putative N6-adenine-specific methylase [Deltaproteobacteria bacterium]|nr:putative N6-adenine-specific methylase [Deltaproteobacteria bacterium]